MCTPTPIPNYRELGLPPDAKYFNGGLLVANIAQWRRENYAGRMVKCLRDHREHVIWWDQYALNVVLANKWRELDPRWNQGAHIFVYPNWRESPLDRDTFAHLRLDPWIVHFCSPSKPWHYFCHHPFARDFFRCLDQTDWKGWRPERPDRFWHKWWDFHYRPLRNKWKTNVRSAKQFIRDKRRAA
jgi:lipopolysaccharide biosynthesis glycosyltransferase